MAMNDLREIAARWRRCGSLARRKCAAPFRSTYFSESRRQGDLACLVDELYALVRLDAPLPEGLQRCAATYREQMPSRAWVLLGAAGVAGLAAWIMWLKAALLPLWERSLTTFATAVLMLLLGLLVRRFVGLATMPQRRARMFRRVALRLEQGDTLADTLAAMSRLVPRGAVDLVGAGEAADRLPEMLERIRRYLRHEADIRQSARAGLLYLSVVGFVVFTLSLLAFGATFPVLDELLRDLEEGAAPATWAAVRFLQDEFGIFVDNIRLVLYHAPYMFLAPMLAAVVLWLLVWLRWWRPGKWVSALVAGSAYGARFRRQRTGARACAVLGPLLAAGMPLPKALAATTSTGMPRAARAALERVRKSVESGTPLSEALRSHASGVLPPSLAPFVALGEQGGAVAEAIDYLADLYTSELQRRRQVMTAFIVPCGILALGCVVLAVTSIFTMTWTGIGDALFYSL